MCIQDLVTGNSGRVFVYLANTEISRRFLQDAENEGFTFCDGAKPTSRRADNIMAVNEDRTINYVGFAGHVAFGSATEIGGRPLIMVDYQNFSKYDPSGAVLQIEDCPILYMLGQGRN